MKIPENIEKEPDEPEAADADIQMEYSDQSYSPKYSSSNKKITCKNLGQYRFYPSIWNTQ